MIWFNIFLTNTNIFELTKKGKYKYEYIQFKKGGKQIYSGWKGQIGENTNIQTGIYEYEYEYLSHSVLNSLILVFISSGWEKGE